MDIESKDLNTEGTLPCLVKYWRADQDKTLCWEIPRSEITVTNKYINNITPSIMRIEVLNPAGRIAIRALPYSFFSPTFALA